MRIKSTLFLIFLSLSASAGAQDTLAAASPSIARHWMDVLLHSIARDGRGPSIHARNMFHLSAAMYDAWAFFDGKAQPWLLGTTRDGISCPCGLNPDTLKGDRDSLLRVTISYAAFRILETRFDNFSGKTRTLDVIYEGLSSQGLERGYTSVDFHQGAAALGNYLGACYLKYGYEDGSREADDYEDFIYIPKNEFLKPNLPGTNIAYPNLWQPLKMREYISQRGGDPLFPPSNLVIAQVDQVFLTAEWGDLKPFALTGAERTQKDGRNGDFPVYCDPGPPPLLSDTVNPVEPGTYPWGFALVALWSGLHDPADSVYIDISPGAIGIAPALPTGYSAYGDFYDQLSGGLKGSKGHPTNPKTGKPYAPNRVLRGDYTRVLAEFWADAINTATPPGHWFNILNDVTDHPEFKRKWMGKGKKLDLLEWEIKAYFALGGAMHDSAIACWSVKGHYDYVRPISAIRYLAGMGQSSDPEKPSYHPQGLPLIKGRIELVGKKDPLAGENGEHVGKIKIRAWLGPDAIKDFKADLAGVGWILGENWWPYQRYSVPTPNFAGYVSGHSTFSSAAAEVLSTITGDDFFPGGIAEYTAKKDSYLKFERGPSRDLTLQWATYRDAASETCLSRIYGGIHPPCDDVPGRTMGRKIGAMAVQKAMEFMR